MKKGFSKILIIVILCIVLGTLYFVFRTSGLLGGSINRDITIPQTEQEFIDSSKEDVPENSNIQKQEYLESIPGQKQQSPSGNLNVQQQKQDFLNEFNS